MSTATFKILVGSYTDSIYTLAFDPAPLGANSSPTLTLHARTCVGDCPSWIEPHPSDRSLVFATLEQPVGMIVAVKYGADGSGHKVAEAPSGGASPCTLLVTEDELVVGNYMGGTLATVPVATTSPHVDVAQLWTLAFPFEHDKPGRVLSRQEATHPHQAVVNSAHVGGQELLVPDLGSDKVWRLTRADDGHWAIRGCIDVPVGGGPRHVATYGNTLYVLLELTSELAVYSLETGQPPVHLATLSTLRASPTPSGMTAAEILIPKPNRSFPTAYIYTSNRDDPHPDGDTIAIFSLEKGEQRPELVNEVRTGLRRVRGMAFGGEDDKWLVAGGSLAGGIKIYERVEGGRGLREVAELDSAVGSLEPTDFVWL